MNKRQKKKKFTESVYRFGWNENISMNLCTKGNQRTKLIYRLAVKYGLLGIGRRYKDFY